MASRSGWSQDHPPPSMQKKYNAHVFRPNGRGRANQGTPTTHRGHYDRRGAAGSACYEGKRWPEAAGGGRRRPEATEGEARVKNRPFLFRSKEQRKKAPSQNNHNNPRRRRRSLRWLPCRRRRQRHFTETAPERQRRGEKRRSAGGENGGRAEKNTHRAPHTTTPTTAAARAEEEKRGPKETQSRAGDLRSRRGIQRRARSELRCVINPHNRAVGSWR